MEEGAETVKAAADTKPELVRVKSAEILAVSNKR